MYTTNLSSGYILYWFRIWSWCAVQLYTQYKFDHGVPYSHTPNIVYRLQSVQLVTLKDVVMGHLTITVQLEFCFGLISLLLTCSHDADEP